MPAATPELRNKLADLRREHGLTQAALAARIGVSRQFLNQMESGRTLPNVLIALRLAAALGKTVETLFGDAATAAGEPRVRVELPAGRLPVGSRLRLARVGSRWIGHAADTATSLSAGFAPADAVLMSDDSARLLRPEERVWQSVLVAGCDPALALLTGAESEDTLPVHWLDRGSGAALEALLAGQVHVAGLHYAGDHGVGNRRELRRRAPSTGWTLVRFSRWEQGWILRNETERQFAGTADLGTGRWTLANRAASAAARRWLDDALRDAGIPPSRVRGYDVTHPTAAEAARAVAERRADVTLGPRATAVAHGLAFVPTGAVDFDLAAPTTWWRSPAGRRLRARVVELSESGAFEALPGYAPIPAGDEREEAPPRMRAVARAQRRRFSA